MTETLEAPFFKDPLKKSNAPEPRQFRDTIKVIAPKMGRI
jgi:hypothetical protein